MIHFSAAIPWRPVRTRGIFLCCGRREWACHFWGRLGGRWWSAHHAAPSEHCHLQLDSRTKNRGSLRTGSSNSNRPCWDCLRWFPSISFYVERGSSQ